MTLPRTVCREDAFTMSFPRFRRRDRSVGDVEDEVWPLVALPALPDRNAVLGDEVEAFLEGRLVEHLLARGRVVPAWTVLNKVAHATFEELVGLARSGASEGAEPVWLRAQRALAAELVDRSSTPGGVVGVQREMLVPLELWLIERSQAETMTSRRVIEIASDVLAGR
jgi:hypothetical protein